MIQSRSLVRHKGMHMDSYDCALNNEYVEETTQHLRCDSSFSHSCQGSIIPQRHRGISSFDEVTLLKCALPKKIAMDIIILGCR